MTKENEEVGEEKKKELQANQTFRGLCLGLCPLINWS
jgi:hypothetical protein